MNKFTLLFEEYLTTFFVFKVLKVTQRSLGNVKLGMFTLADLQEHRLYY